MISALRFNCSTDANFQAFEPDSDNRPRKNAQVPKGSLSKAGRVCLAMSALASIHWHVASKVGLGVYKKAASWCSAILLL